MIAAAVLGAFLAVAPQADRPPNVLFILTDDLGWGDLGCYGHRRIRTPHLDRLAEQGTLFGQFYVNGSVCSPSRVAFTTGRYPARFKVHGHFADAQRNRDRGMPDSLEPGVVTLPRLLKDAGYATGHIGKWHMGTIAPSEYGFTSHKTNDDYDDHRDVYFRAKSTGLFVDDAIAFLEENADRPFYLNLWTLVPHATLHPTDEQMEPYRELGVAGTPYHGAAKIYYATVTAMDAEIGRLLAALDRLGLAENTIVLFSSDNGPEDIHIANANHSGIGSPGNFRGRKRSLYEGGIRVPLLVRWPGKVPAGAIDEESVLGAVDFLPTLGKLAGASIPADLALDGEDAADVLLGSSRPRTKPLFWNWRYSVAGYPIHHCPQIAVRDGNWKLLLNPDRSRVELYDIPNDPMEMTNLAEEQPSVVERLATSAIAWEEELPDSPTFPGAGTVRFGWPGR